MSVLVFADPAVESSDRATRAQVHVREAFTYGFKSLDDDLVLGVEVVPHDHEPILVQEVKVDEMHKLFLHSVSHVLRVAEHELELLPVLLNFAPGSVVKNITSNVPQCGASRSLELCDGAFRTPSPKRIHRLFQIPSINFASFSTKKICKRGVDVFDVDTEKECALGQSVVHLVQRLPYRHPKFHVMKLILRVRSDELTGKRQEVREGCDIANIVIDHW
eukprot:CAMPEP_0175807038 /NCGR_PEP_ID=MMETSP0107_2-20121207/1510_1 /TAXON_ID=195067 ORGANISM="Goniomonas pacifica, Strain CCMP1869" /NCGR_SAMPLE_ID=MMETSP0107_2 /ASSEMBLY_ACC=CAM_ASM_000203 /LENGTH=218 /DNA_ID=CAMNT_0017118567 /DNA_START=92 /DNA_END=745 /DNA_ORIENTATION=+